MQTITLTINHFLSEAEVSKAFILLGLNTLSGKNKEIFLYPSYFKKLLTELKTKDNYLYSKIDNILSTNNFTEIKFIK